jgi:hypothetical protein
MHSDRLFAGPDFHSVLEHYKTKLVQAYEQLLDEEALDEQVQKTLKGRFSLDVPVRRSQGEIWAEESTAKIDVRRLPNRLPGFGDRAIMEEVPEFTVHVPFDGDPDVFNIAPSIYSVSPASGKIVGQELLLKFVMAMPGLDLQGSLDSTLGQINSALGHLREQMVVFRQGLDIALSQAVMLRMQRMQMRSSAVHNLKIPVRTTPPRKPLRLVPESESPRSKTEQTKSQMWDVFISHASEDKAYVEEVHRTFVATGIQVWVDKGVLRWGDRLRSRIDDGLKRSQFVIVVLSNAFLRMKKWTEYELDSAFALETVREERILPLWHGITPEELVEYSPGLSNRLALDSSKQSPTDLANELLILLKRRPEGAFPIAEMVPVSEPPSHATEEVKKGETVAYAWYWTREGKVAGLYIRRSPSKADRFTLEEPDGTVHEGGNDEIASKYVTTDVKLRSEGLRRSSVMSSGDYPKFNLP